MKKYHAALVKYERPASSVRRAVHLSRGLEGLPPGGSVFIKPNIVFWTDATPFPKWGVVTTSRVIEDLVILLKDSGVDDITIGEGIVTPKPKDKKTPAHAFESLGYNLLKERYGVKTINVFERPYKEMDLGEGIKLNFNVEAMECDFLINLPVLKTHAQTVISGGLKNLKGLIDLESRKKCHSADPDRDLHYMIARLADRLPPSFTLIDGIYTLERGPAFDGRPRRSDILVAAGDTLTADMIGARLLGYEPSDVPHLRQAAQNRGRPLDLSDVDLSGENIEDLASYHAYDFPYTEDGSLPVFLEKTGIQGLAYYKYDSTMCTYCSAMNGLLLASIAMAWQGGAWDDVEVLTGKIMQPRPGRKKTILLGQCIYDLHKNNPVIQEAIPVKGCPPLSKKVIQALHQAGIEIDPGLLEHPELAPGFFYDRYKDRPEFVEDFYQIK